MRIHVSNVQCMSPSIGTPAPEYYCTPSAHPIASQLCINYEIGCTPRDSAADSGDIDVFGVHVQKNAVLFGSLGECTYVHKAHIHTQHTKRTFIHVAGSMRGLVSVSCAMHLCSMFPLLRCHLPLPRHPRMLLPSCHTRPDR